MLIYQPKLWFSIFNKSAKTAYFKFGTLLWWVNAIFCTPSHFTWCYFFIHLPALDDVFFYPLSCCTWCILSKRFLGYDPAKFHDKKWGLKPPFFICGFLQKLSKSEFFPESREIFPNKKWKKSEKRGIPKISLEKWRLNGVSVQG